MNIQGTVEQVFSRAAGRGTAYNIKVNGQYYGCGFQPPSCSEGDNVSFEIEQNAKGYWNVSGPIQVTGKAAPPQPNQGNQGQQKPQTGGNSRDQYWQEKEQRDIANQKIIQYQASRNAAIEVVKSALENDALSLGQKKQGKLDVLLAVIDEVTDRFDKDSIDMRDYGYRTGEYNDNQRDNNAENQHFAE